MDKLQRVNDFSSIIRIVERIIKKNRVGADQYKTAGNIMFWSLIPILEQIKKDNDAIINAEKYG